MGDGPPPQFHPQPPTAYSLQCVCEIFGRQKNVILAAVGGNDAVSFALGSVSGSLVPECKGRRSIAEWHCACVLLACFLSEPTEA